MPYAILTVDGWLNWFSGAWQHSGDPAQAQLQVTFALAFSGPPAWGGPSRLVPSRARILDPPVSRYVSWASVRRIAASVSASQSRGGWRNAISGSVRPSYGQMAAPVHPSRLLIREVIRSAQVKHASLIHGDLCLLPSLLQYHHHTKTSVLMAVPDQSRRPTRQNRTRCHTFWPLASRLASCHPLRCLPMLATHTIRHRTLRQRTFAATKLQNGAIVGGQSGCPSAVES